MVPNALSPWYRICFGIRKLLYLWPPGLPEIPYSRFELKKIATDLGLENISLVSTWSMWQDFDYWFLNNGKSLLKKMGLYQPTFRTSTRVLFGIYFRKMPGVSVSYRRSRCVPYPTLRHQNWLFVLSNGACLSSSVHLQLGRRNVTSSLSVVRQVIQGLD